ncbi:MAG: class I SAM-dependent methyltransferase [Cyanobacteria bacterium]|nr:class I SAM-dependent methyltransferase [Cyanobacteriota bacterium]
MAILTDQDSVQRDAYLAQRGYHETPDLAALREETLRLGGPARMQVSPDEGQFLAFLLRVLGAKRYLEVGTFTGYSTLWCASALPPAGEVLACDVSKEWTDIAVKHWKQAGVASKIDLRLAPAEETLQALLAQGQAGSFDMMFIDADKENYLTYYQLGLQLVRSGGVLAFDNVFWGGDVWNNAITNDPETTALRELNQTLHQDALPGGLIECLSMLTIRDGLTLVKKK